MEKKNGFRKFDSLCLHGGLRIFLQQRLSNHWEAGTKMSTSVSGLSPGCLLGCGPI